jgi:thiol-disulfide isomerase/thioredoxin
MVQRKNTAIPRLTFVVALLVVSVLVAGARAAEHVSWNQAAFAAAQDSGKSIIVEVTAPWCPICAKQKPTIAALEQDPKFAQAVIFSVDFDSEKDVLKQLHVSMQSTLIAFKGKVEEARSTGVTDPAELRALFERSL